MKVSNHLRTWAGAALVNSAIAGSYPDRYPDCDNGPLRSNDVCNVKLAPSKRAAALVEAMDITEKLVNLVDLSKGSTRLGMPQYHWWGEALHGVAYAPGVHFADTPADFSSATSFPCPITVAAAFDDDLVEKIGSAIGQEGRAFGNVGRTPVNFWTPNINPYKDPRWGRGLETPGEDPLRITNYVRHLLRGMEWAGQEPTESSQRQIIATCKHYAANDLEKSNGVDRHSFDAKVSMQDLVEYYLPPFKQCARDSNVGSIMCSYNSVNGEPACANKYLLQTVLREHWNWTKHNNYVVSDCNAVFNMFADHKWVNSTARAAGAAYTAGTDNVCEDGGNPTNVMGAYNQSLLSVDVVDQALRRQYEGLIRAGYFEPSAEASVGYRSYGWDKVNTKEAQALAKSSAVDGTVLLKNDGILPLTFKKNQTVAVIGMWAYDYRLRIMLGIYYGRPPFYITPRQAAQELGLNVLYSQNYQEMLEAARKADIVIYFGGIDPSIENEGRDRVDVAWPANQTEFLGDLKKVGKPIIVAQLGTAIDHSELLADKDINAILWFGYPGMSGGHAVFDIITGVKAPAGRLPVTQYPKNYTDLVPMTDMTLRPSATNPGRTYKWYNTAVQEFGFGLHYTNFTIGFGSKLNPLQGSSLLAACKEAHKDLCAFPSIPVTVTNRGNVTSDFIALAFISTKAGPAPHPIKELGSYKRLRDIKGGEERKADLEFTFGTFARTNEQGDTVLYEGEYCLILDVPEQARTCFEISGGDVVLDKWPQPQKN